MEAGQYPGAHRIAADIQHAGDLPVFQNGQKFRRQGGHVRVRAGLGRGHQTDARVFQDGFAFPGAEVGVDDIEIRQHHLLLAHCQLQRQVHGKLGLSGAVVPGDDGDAVGANLICRQTRIASCWENFLEQSVVLFLPLLYDVIVLLKKYDVKRILRRRGKSAAPGRRRR